MDEHELSGEGREAVAKLLTAVANAIRQTGFPKEPFILQSSPLEDYCFYLGLWRGKRYQEWATEVRKEIR